MKIIKYAQFILENQKALESRQWKEFSQYFLLEVMEGALTSNRESIEEEWSVAIYPSRESFAAIANLLLFHFFEAEEYRRWLETFCIRPKAGMLCLELVLNEAGLTRNQRKLINSELNAFLPEESREKNDKRALELERIKEMERQLESGAAWAD